MYRGNPASNFSMPGEYRKAAERLFPKDGFNKGYKPDLKAIGEFAKVLGIGIEFQRLLALDKNSGELRTFLDHFQNNLDLLIKKTWVDKSDENRKGKLQNDVPKLMLTIEQADFTSAINEFSIILDELAYLFFGQQSEVEDFTEYTFRIDAQMGLFWWYGGKLALLDEINKNNADKSDKVLWAVMLLGLCYLTNF
ncbi:MAG: hypothetical protein FWD14_06710 [Treponema sp.]|nr:hypothetical protein [Treponema sp.]